MNQLIKVLAVFVNYGDEQIHYLQELVDRLTQFKKYEVRIVVNSNIDIKIRGVDELNIIELDDYQFLPLTCRKVIWDKKDEFDIYIYGENDHLFTEKHIDNHISYSKFLPKNRISGLIQYEEDDSGKYYPAYHADFEWDFNSVEVYNGKKFAHFSNIHQATFILTIYQLKQIGSKIDFESLKNERIYLKKKINKVKRFFGIKTETLYKYSVKCKVNTDIYEFGGMKKLICISEFEDNLIHHLPNLYIEGLKGRNKLMSDSARMNSALNQLLN